MTIEAYPLSWPEGWPRTQRSDRKVSQYSDKTFSRVRKEIQQQVRLLGGTDLVISTNITLRRDGLPYSSRKQPYDTGVAIYFNRKGKPMCFASDKWLTTEENAWAICLTINALRSIERAGASDMLERAFTGFLALPAPKKYEWQVVLGVDRDADWETIKSMYRKRVQPAHPDAGGNADEFQRIIDAFAAAKEERGMK